MRIGIPWWQLPTRQLGGGSLVTCWRRLHDRQRAGVEADAGTAPGHAARQVWPAADILKGG